MLRSAALASALLAFTLAACGGATTTETGASQPSPEAPLPRGPQGPSEDSPPAEGAPRPPTKTSDLGTPDNVAIPFHVLASNQSFDIDPVDIDLYIDGKHVVTGDFEVGSQHTWVGFDFSIAPGEHTLRAVSKKGATDETATFLVNATERWAVVNFWYYATPQGGQAATPPSFGIDLFDSEPMFQ
jgi:hypothetical protein